LRRKYQWPDHLIRANEAFTERYGNHYAAAITYFSVLSVIPILMVSFAILGFIVNRDQAVMDQIITGIKKFVPAGLNDTVSSIVKTSLDSYGGVGIFGLLLALYSGIGWMSNLRDALTVQWGQEKKQLPLVSTTIKDLLALIGLGVALVISFGLTAIGSSVGRYLLELVGLENQGWAVFLLKLATILLGLIANMLVFLWVLSRLPREKVSPRSAVKGAIFAAVGFVILQQIATVYLTSVTKSPSFAVFGPVIGLLVFANLVSRFLLFVTAWTATAKENTRAEVAPPPPATIRPRVSVQRGPGAGAVAGAFSAGAILGWLGRHQD
jgi:membrane protein